MTPEERRRVAVHEAAHACLDVIFGRTLEYASIRGGRTFGGVTVLVPHELPDLGELAFDATIIGQPAALRAAVERSLISRLAGDIAERLLAPMSTGYLPSNDEAESIARGALAALAPRRTELVVANENREDSLGADEQVAWDLAETMTGPSIAAHYLEWLREEARAMVWRYQAAILRVADALERHAVLEGAQIAALVHPEKGSQS